MPTCVPLPCHCYRTSSAAARLGSVPSSRFHAYLPFPFRFVLRFYYRSVATVRCGSRNVTRITLRGSWLISLCVPLPFPFSDSLYLRFGSTPFTMVHLVCARFTDHSSLTHLFATFLRFVAARSAVCRSLPPVAPFCGSTVLRSTPHTRLPTACAACATRCVRFVFVACCCGSTCKPALRLVTCLTRYHRRGSAVAFPTLPRGSTCVSLDARGSDTARFAIPFYCLPTVFLPLHLRFTLLVLVLTLVLPFNGFAAPHLHTFCCSAPGSVLPQRSTVLLLPAFCAPFGLPA